MDFWDEIISINLSLTSILYDRKRIICWIRSWILMIPSLWKSALLTIYIFLLHLFSIVHYYHQALPPPWELCRGWTCTGTIFSNSSSITKVWPGDLDNNGLVEAADVLSLGVHWKELGPARNFASNDWTSQGVLAWENPTATYADANGDGIVNMSDLLIIG